MKSLNQYIIEKLKVSKKQTSLVDKLIKLMYNLKIDNLHFYLNERLYNLIDDGEFKGYLIYNIEYDKQKELFNLYYTPNNLEIKNNPKIKSVKRENLESHLGTEELEKIIDYIDY